MHYGWTGSTNRLLAVGIIHSFDDQPAPVLQAEDSHVDSSLAEITSRYMMIHLLDTEIARSQDANMEVAKRVYSLCQQDPYFRESMISPDTLQTMGFMRQVRNNLDLLESPGKVKDEMAVHLRSLDNLKELVEAAFQAATQYKSRARAVKQARTPRRGFSGERSKAHPESAEERRR